MNTLVNSKPQLFRTQFHSIQKLPFSQRQRSEHTADCSMFQACFWLHAPLGMFIIFHRIKQRNDELLCELGQHQGLIKKEVNDQIPTKNDAKIKRGICGHHTIVKERIMPYEKSPNPPAGCILHDLTWNFSIENPFRTFFFLLLILWAFLLCVWFLSFLLHVYTLRH